MMPPKAEPRVADLVEPFPIGRPRPPAPTTTANKGSVYAQVPRHLVMSELFLRLSAPAADCWMRFPSSMKLQYVSEVYRRAENVAAQDHTIAEAVDFALTDVASILNKCAERIAE